MKLTLLHRPSVPPSASPYRLLDERGQEVALANAFLDAQRIRQLSLRSLRAYAYDLLHFARWFLTPPGIFPTSPNPACWTTSATNWSNYPSPRPRPSIIAWVWCAAYIASTMDVRSPPVTLISSAATPDDPPSVMAGREVPWLGVCV